MDYIYNAIILILLSIISYQDFKSLKISWILFIPLIVTFIFKGSYHTEKQTYIQNILLNLGYILFITSVINLYYIIKQKKLIFILNNYLGLGDFILFICFCLII